jgi:lysyl-tRNA synthetase class 2
MIPVESSSVKSLGYDASKQQLHVQFIDMSDAYVYDGVPQWVYKQLIESSSKGRFINRVIKPRYAFRKAS